eukprot:1043204-Rhodomonas_salina.1
MRQMGKSKMMRIHIQKLAAILRTRMNGEERSCLMKRMMFHCQTGVREFSRELRTAAVNQKATSSRLSPGWTSAATHPQGKPTPRQQQKNQNLNNWRAAVLGAQAITAPPPPTPPTTQTQARSLASSLLSSTPSHESSPPSGPSPNNSSKRWTFKASLS